MDCLFLLAQPHSTMPLFAFSLSLSLYLLFRARALSLIHFRAGKCDQLLAFLRFRLKAVNALVFLCRFRRVLRSDGVAIRLWVCVRNGDSTEASRLLGELLLSFQRYLRNHRRYVE